MGDVQRAKDLQRYAEDMGLNSDDLEWALNASVDKVAALLEVIELFHLCWNVKVRFKCVSI